jgi:prolipoprotein diacylglyceryltransferase
VGYELLMDLLIFAVLVAVFGRLPLSSMVFWLYGALYSFGRFFIQFYRVDTPFVANLSQAQIMSFVVGAAALWVLVFCYSRSRRRPVSAVADEPVDELKPVTSGIKDDGSSGRSARAASRAPSRDRPAS